MYVYDFIHPNQIPPLSSRNFQKIIEFYLLKCPVRISRTQDNKRIYRRVSHLGRTLNDRGFRGSKLVALHKAMRICSRLHYLTDLSVSLMNNPTAVKDAINQAQINDNDEFCVVAEKTNVTKVEAIYYCIRNAMAHGSFSVHKLKGGLFYRFENMYNRKLQGRIQLHENTLLRWITLVESVGQELAKTSSITYGEMVEIAQCAETGARKILDSSNYN